jgi:polar amino acid transport system substrate-binding protein
MTVRGRVAAGLLVAGGLLVGSGCTSNTTAVAPISTTTTTVAAASPATTPPACGNPVASFAPDGPVPAVGDVSPNTFMAKIRARGRLVAGVSADTLLFGYRNPLTGKLEGFDIDMLHQVAKAVLGDPNRIQYKVLTYAQRIPALTKGDVDIVADVMTINCTRWQQIDFSAEYFTAGQQVLVRKDSSARTINDLDGKMMCAARGSTNIDELKKYPKIVVVPVDDISDCLVLFQQGSVDSITGDNTVLAGFVAQDPYAKQLTAPALTSEPYGLGIAKTHPEFVRYVNGVLEQMHTDGTWSRLDARWLKPATPDKQPTPVYGRQP